MKFLQRLSAAALASAFAAGAAFAAYPDRPVKVVNGFAPGGGSDILLRAIVPAISERLGQPLVIDYKVGAGGNVAIDTVAKAPPDGYTLLMGFAGLTTAPFLFSKLPFDPLKDLAPITMLVTMPYIIVAHPSVPAKNAGELIKLAKANPGKLNMASGGAGTGQHLAGELFNVMAGIKMIHIPYKGTAPAIADIMGGHADLTFSDPSVLPQLQAGRLKVIGVSGSKHYPPLPNVPTVSESGLPGFDALNWYPFMAPTGTPKELIARLNTEAVKALNAPDVKEKLLAQGLIPAPMTPDELGRFIREDYERWEKVIKLANVKLN